MINKLAIQYILTYFKLCWIIDDDFVDGTFSKSIKVIVISITKPNL